MALAVTVCTSLILLSSIIAGLLLLEKGLAVSARSPTGFLTGTTYGPHFLSPLLGLPSAWPPVLGTGSGARDGAALSGFQPFHHASSLLACGICATHVLESGGCRSHIIFLGEVDKTFGVT